MKIVIAVVILLVIVLAVFLVKRFYVSVGFANEITLRYHINDKKITVVLTDEDDISELKGMLRGMSFRDNSSCGFSIDVSIIFSNGDRSITLCPAAADECPILRINDSNRFIRIKDGQRQRLVAIFEKYGATLPV
jgi:hypothetical protein